MTTQQTASAPAINFREAEPFQFLGQPTQLRASAESTNGAFGLIEHWSLPPGFGSPYHTHRNEDETFYVLEGEVAFVCDGNWMRGGPGTYVFGPRGVPHGFQVIGNTPARMLILATPGGFEQFVLELSMPIDTPPAPPDMAKLGATAAKFGIDIHGPLPELPAGFIKPDSSDVKALNQRWIDAFNDRDWVAEASFRAHNFRATLRLARTPRWQCLAGIPEGLCRCIS